MCLFLALSLSFCMLQPSCLLNSSLTAKAHKRDMHTSPLHASSLSLSHLQARTDRQAGRRQKNPHASSLSVPCRWYATPPLLFHHPLPCPFAIPAILPFPFCTLQSKACTCLHAHSLPSAIPHATCCQHLKRISFMSHMHAHLTWEGGGTLVVKQTYHLPLSSIFFYSLACHTACLPLSCILPAYTLYSKIITLFSLVFGMCTGIWF